MRLLLALGALAGGAFAQDVSINDCFGYYVDGFIYQKTTDPGAAPFPELPNSRSFKLALYAEEKTAERVYVQQHLTRQSTGGHWDVFPDVLYLDSSPGAYGPVGFKNPSELVGGEVDRYWGFSYGAMWHADKPVIGSWTETFTKFSNGGGFTHEPVEGRSDVVQLYWNQTQFEEFQARRTPREDAPWFPYCFGGSIESVDFKDHP